jgi:hypothetical protein
VPRSSPNDSRFEKASPLSRNVEPEDLIGIWRGDLQVLISGRVNWRVGIAIARVLPAGENRWQLVTIGSGAQNVTAHRDDGRIVVDFEIVDKGRVQPHRGHLTLNRQATRLEGFIVNAVNSGDASYHSLWVTLERQIVRVWTPTPEEVRPATQVRTWRRSRAWRLLRRTWWAGGPRLSRPLEDPQIGLS